MWDFKKVFVYKRQKEEYDKKYKKVKVNLPKSEWFKCPTCNGKRLYLEEGDAHKSTGIVPCYNCNSDGLRTYDYIDVLREKEECI